MLFRKVLFLFVFSRFGFSWALFSLSWFWGLFVCLFLVGVFWGVVIMSLKRSNWIRLFGKCVQSACDQKERTTRSRVSLGVVKKYGSIQQVFQDFGKHAADGESKYKCGERWECKSTDRQTDRQLLCGEHEARELYTSVSEQHQETDMMSLLVFYRLCRRRHQEQQQQVVRSKGDGHCGRAPWVIVSGREKGHLRRIWSQYQIQSSHHLGHLSSHPLLLLLRLCSLPTDLRFASKPTSEDSWSVCSMHSENHIPHFLQFTSAHISIGCNEGLWSMHF